MSDDLVQPTSETDGPKCDHPGSEFKAKAREIAEAVIGTRKLRMTVVRNDEGEAVACLASEDTVPIMEAAIANALAEAYAKAYERIAELEKALAPFEAIEPSSLYPADGSENEPYAVVLRDPYGGPGPVAFTGGDLAAVRAVLSQGDRTASVSDQRELEPK